MTSVQNSICIHCVQYIHRCDTYSGMYTTNFLPIFRILARIFCFWYISDIYPHCTKHEVQTNLPSLVMTYIFCTFFHVDCGIQIRSEVFRNFMLWVLRRSFKWHSPRESISTSLHFRKCMSYPL